MHFVAHFSSCQNSFPLWPTKQYQTLYKKTHKSMPWRVRKNLLKQPVVGFVSVVTVCHDRLRPYFWDWFTNFHQFNPCWVQNHKVNPLKMLPLYRVPEDPCVLVCVVCVCLLMCAVRARSFKQLQYWSCGLRRRRMWSRAWHTHTSAHKHTHTQKRGLSGYVPAASLSPLALSSACLPTHTHTTRTHTHTHIHIRSHIDIHTSPPSSPHSAHTIPAHTY